MTCWKRSRWGVLCESYTNNSEASPLHTHTHTHTHSIIVMDHDDFGSDNPLGAARIPLYEATGPEGMHLKKLLADLSSIRVRMGMCVCVGGGKGG